MGPQTMKKNNAGLTMVELMIAAAIFSSSMVLLSGTMVTFTRHNTISEQKALTTAYNRSVFEDVRGRGLVGILNYQVPLDNPEFGTVFIPGMGDARVTVWAIIPQTVDPTNPDAEATGYDRWFLMGEEDPSTVVNPPNPLEIVVEVAKASSAGQEYDREGGIQFSSSTMIAY